MRRGAGRGKPDGPIRLPLAALGFKCVNCRNEFESRHAIDVHRRHPFSVGTPCADPRNHKSMSMTDRVDQAVGMLRHHDTLGVLCCPPLMFVLLITCSHANTTYYPNFLMNWNNRNNRYDCYNEHNREIIAHNSV